MAQYIDKSDVVAEIERIKHKLLDHIICERDKEWAIRTAHQLNRIIWFINTLEVKEIDADWLTRNDLAVFSDPRGQNIRAKIRVVDYDPSRSSGIHNLLKRAMKEYLVRKETFSVDPSDIKDEDVVWFCCTLLQQTYENLRENPSDKQAQTVQKILTKIKNDYGREIKNRNKD